MYMYMCVCSPGSTELACVSITLRKQERRTLVVKISRTRNSAAVRLPHSKKRVAPADAVHAGPVPKKSRRMASVGDSSDDETRAPDAQAWADDAYEHGHFETTQPGSSSDAKESSDAHDEKHADHDGQGTW